MSRQCGNCQACCTVLPIKQLNKPAGTPCPKLCAEGCSIHATRPQVCRGWNCSWLDGELGLDDRPDKSGAVVWTVAMPTVIGDTARVVHANFRPGKRNKKIMRWLMRSVEPVMLTQGDTVELYIAGKFRRSWPRTAKIEVNLTADAA